MFPFVISMLSFLAGTAQSPSSSYKVVAKDAAWCWFADPRAVYFKGKAEKIYYGYINSKGDVVLNSREVKSKAIQTFILHDKLQIDDHNVPTILFLPDGKLLTFYTEHNGRFFMRKSKNVEDISTWEEERVLTFGTPENIITYSNPVMLTGENNRIYVFFRGRNKKTKENPDYVDWKQYYTYSDDLGETWSNAVYYFSSKGVYNPPYQKIASDYQSKIHILITDGHPKLGLSSVYHLYFEKDKFYQTNGEEILGANKLPMEFKQIHKVYDVDVFKVKSWIWDIALDRQGNPVITYGQYPSVNDHIYHYAKWNGSKWEDHKLINAGSYITQPEKNGKVLEEHYSGGVVLDHHNPANVYLSRQVDGIFEIEHWELKGSKWHKNIITSKSRTNNIRPYVVDNYIGKPIVMWMNGDYEHYIRFKTNLLINEK